jgi:serine/threonine-protein kinase
MAVIAPVPPFGVPPERRTNPRGLGADKSGARQLPVRQCPTCGELFPGDYRVCPRDAIDLVEPDAGADPLLGAVLNDTYQIVRMVGEGGMGRVYEARHTRLTSRTHAVKVLHEFHARHREITERFCREAETTSAVRHENVIEVFDIDATEHGIPYIVYEFLRGEDLGELLDRVGSLPESVCAQILQQVCRALQAAHDVGVVHRDLKPENLYIESGRSPPAVKLLDFGIARVEDPATAMHTRTGVIMGTPAFMAPEQAMGSKVDHRADIYSVGAILYRMSTGRCAHEREDPAQTLSALLTEEPARPREIAPHISGAFELVIQRAMSRDVETRYQSMLELEAELAAFVVDPRGSTSEPAESSSTAVGVLDTGMPMRGLIASASRQSRGARPWIVFSMLLIALWSYGVLVEALAHLVAILTGAPLASSELVLVTAGTGVAMLTPIVLWIRLMARTVWRNSVVALTAARRLRAFSVAALATLGLGHLAHAIVQRFLDLSAIDHIVQLAILGVSFVFGMLARFVAPRES